MSSSIAVEEVTPTAPDEASEKARQRFTRAIGAGIAVAAVPFLWVLWNGGLNPLRTAVPERTFSNFYDLQARAMFRGNWAVPTGKLGIEGFIVDGKTYTYFPPFPSIIRMPVLAVTDALDGRLTAPSMLLAWCVTAIFVGLTLWRVRVLMRGTSEVSRSEAVLVGTLTASLLCGSVLLYLASLPWVYHEAFAWGIAGAAGSLFVLLGILEQPSRRRVLALGGFILVATLSRTTVGWGCVIAAFLAAAWFAFGPDRSNRQWWWPVALAGALPLFAGFAITWMKFGSPFIHPLGSQVWTQVNVHRQEALAANRGSLLNPRFLPTTALAYFRPDGIRLTSLFPFITPPAEPARAIGDVTVDQMYRTPSVTATMPLMLVLTVWGAVEAFVLKPIGKVRLTRIPFIGGVAAVGGVLFYGYVAPRYLGDFVPLLVLGSAVGVIALVHRLRTRAQRIVAVAIVGVLAVYGFAANLAIAVSAERLANGVEQAHQFVELQESIADLTGVEFEAPISKVIPPWGPSDTLIAVDDCAALLASNGDEYEPWVPVAYRELGADVRFRDKPTQGGEIPLFQVGDHPGYSAVSTISLEYDERGRLRIIAAAPYHRRASPWQPVEPGHVYEVRLNPASDVHLFDVSVDGKRRGRVPQHSTKIDAYSEFHLPQYLAPSKAGGGTISIEKVQGDRPELCTRLSVAEQSLGRARARR